MKPRMNKRRIQYEVAGWIYRIVHVRRHWVIQRRSRKSVECWGNNYGWVPWVRGEKWKVSNFRSHHNAQAIANILVGDTVEVQE